MTTTLDTTPSSTQLPSHGAWIGGSDQPAAATFGVQDPATGAEIAHVADATPDLAREAATVAAAALPSWSATAPRVRSDILRRAHELILADADHLVSLICAENGKSPADARAEVTYAAEFFRWFAEEAVRIEGTWTESPAGGTRTVVTHAPVGVAALVTPWNFPAAMATRKIAPALAAGCTVVLKPAAETPLTALVVARILGEAGVPDGVVNVVPTTDAAGVVDALIDHPAVRKISFTGSTRVGRLLLARAADRVLVPSMELGGNAPFVVTADADIEAAVAGAMVAKFRGGGQACTAANRFYVHADVAEEFTTRLAAATAALRVGPAQDPTSEIGPLISATAVAGVQAIVDSALEAGATVAARAEAPEQGCFFPPTVLADVPLDAEILRHEIFGPVAPVTTWTDTEELLAHVNDTELGLAAYVYAGELQDALRLAERIEAGMVGINRGLVSDPAAPFGGVKQSGLGREGAHEGIRDYLETRYFSVAW